MFKFTMWLLLIAVALGGCASARKIHILDGSEGYSINCSGGDSTWGNCYEKAGDVCGARGYNILEKISEQSTSSSGNIIEQHGGTATNRNMIIKCRD